MGRPKSATFRTCDVVGLDTLVHVANGLFAVAKSDEQHALFALPEFIQTMITNQWLGDKTKQGFYKKTKGENGEKEILVLDLNTLEYRKQNKVKFASYEAAKLIDDLPSRLQHLYNANDKAGAFYMKMMHSLFS
jgi:3-hydroxyacyl-CoA dehydrogenase